jgi:hypothetical protein
MTTPDELTGATTRVLLSLGYEPYDVRLYRLGRSPAAALTRQTCGMRVSLVFYVSPVSARPVESRAQISLLAC